MSCSRKAKFVISLNLNWKCVSALLNDVAINCPVFWLVCCEIVWAHWTVTCKPLNVSWNIWRCCRAFCSSSTVSWVFFSSPLLEPGKHKHRKCERPLSAQPSKPVIVRPGFKRYDFSFCNTACWTHKPFSVTIHSASIAPLFPPLDLLLHFWQGRWVV